MIGIPKTGLYSKPLNQYGDDDGFSDIRSASLIIEILPDFAKPYAFLARLDRPVGTWLLLVPGLWAIVLASGGLNGMSLYGFWLLVLFALGAVLMRSAGCVINDLWDQDLDAQVERTRARPLASGALSPKEAYIFLFGLLFFSLLILLQMNWTTILLGILTIPLIVAYPLMKRFTFWPQAFLGLTFNFGALMGWAAVSGSISFAALFLYVSGIFWTLGYDTIYAYQDKDDDAMVGIKSTALIFGENAKIWVGAFYILSATFLMLSVMFVNAGWLAVIAMFAALGHFGYQLALWDRDDQDSCLKIFKSNRDYGLIILAILCLA